MFVCFIHVKVDMNKAHKHNLVCFSMCPSTISAGSYIGETVFRLSEQVVDNTGRDTMLLIVRLFKL